jgi:hypothetical protein
MRLRFTDSRSEELWAGVRASASLIVVPALAADIRSNTINTVVRHHRLSEPHAFLYVTESSGSREAVDVWMIETPSGCLITATSSATSSMVIAFVASSIEARSVYVKVPSMPPRYTPFIAFLRFLVGLPIDALYELRWLFATRGSGSRLMLHFWQS